LNTLFTFTGIPEFPGCFFYVFYFSRVQGEALPSPPNFFAMVLRTIAKKLQYSQKSSSKTKSPDLTPVMEM